jgi:cytochrome c553
MTGARRNILTRILLGTVSFGLFLQAVALVASAQDAQRLVYGKHLAQECTGCHRVDGIDNGIPSIVAWPEDEFAKTIEFYKSGARKNPVMVSVAGSLNEKQVSALAAYFGSLPKPKPVARKKK